MGGGGLVKGEARRGLPRSPPSEPGGKGDGIGGGREVRGPAGHECPGYALRRMNPASTFP